MERRDDALLQLRLEINQKIAAAHKVDAGEGRVFDQVVCRKKAHFPNVFGNPIVAILLGKITLQPIRRHICNNRSCIQPGPRRRDRAVVDVGGKHLDLSAGIAPHPRLFEEDRDRVRLLTRGTADDPNPDRLGTRLVRKQLWNNSAVQRRKGIAVPKEPRDADQHLTKQHLRLMRQRAQLLDVGRDFLGLQHVHPPLDTAHQRAGLVVAEIPAEPRVQHGANGREMAGQILPNAIRSLGCVKDRPVLPVVQKRLRHVLDGQHVIHKTTRRGALRHALFGVVIELGLAQRQTAMLLDGGDSQRAIAAEPGQDDGDRVLPLILGQRQ